MEDSIRVEMPLRAPSKLLASCNTIEDVRKKYPSLTIVKYIFLDPVDQKLKGVNPPNDKPLVKDAYITVVGSLTEIIRFAQDATS